MFHLLVERIEKTEKRAATCSERLHRILLHLTSILATVLPGSKDLLS